MPGPTQSTPQATGMAATYRRPHDSPHWPPPPVSGETEEQAKRRLEEERRAKVVSDKIDREIEHDRAERKKRKQPSVKILLVGQAESGKSTTLKNFQLHFTPKAFRADAEAWRTVIYLNLVRSINFILDVVSRTAEEQKTTLPSNGRAGPESRPRSSRLSAVSSTAPQLLSPDLRRLRLSLLPLRNAETVLSRRLSVEPPPAPIAAPSSEQASLSTSATSASLGWPLYSTSQGCNSASTSPASSPPSGWHMPTAVRVRSQTKWKQFARLPSAGSLASPPSSPPRNGQELSSRNDGLPVTAKDIADFENACAVVIACAEEMNALWQMQDVQTILIENDIKLRDGPGFFLNDIIRIAARDYVPTIDDVLRARLTTNGVEEHRLKMEIGHEAGNDWIIYDCGGSRSQRAKWAPYFDAVSTIIFLAPISAFDQTLAEDPAIGRLDDTLTLWRAICSNKLLERLQLVLFLNKTDILKRKVASGQRFAEFIPAFNDDDGRKNNYEEIVKFVSNTFTHVHNKYSPRPRTLHIHLTSVVDPAGTFKVLSLVRESVIINALTQGNLL